MIIETLRENSPSNLTSLTYLRRLEHISKKISIPWRLWDVSKHLSQVLWFFKNTPHKCFLCDLRRVTKISDKTDVGPLATLKQWNVFWEQCLGIIKSVMNISGLISAWEFWQVSGRQSPVECVLFTIFCTFWYVFR